jgi:hypothetical protein
MQLITPRRTHARTASYRARAERRETEGRLADPERRAIALAKAQRPEVRGMPIATMAAMSGRGERIRNL